MARRVIEGQIGMFEGLSEVNEGESAHGAGAPTPLQSPSATASPQGEAFGTGGIPQGEGLKSDGEARVLTLEALRGLEPFRSMVWIETRPWATRRETEENAAYRFLLLFEAVFQTIGIPIGSERKHYRFKYIYTDGRNYYHCRVDEFYGREWRVWDKRPTEAQRRETPWLSTK